MKIQRVIQNIVTEIPKKTRELTTVSLPAPLEKDTFQRSTKLLSSVPKKVKKSTLDSLIQVFSAKKYESDFEYLGVTVDEYLTNLVKTENDANILKLDICNSKKCMIPYFNELDEPLFERLCIMKNNNIEKYKKIVNSKHLLDFFKRDITWTTGCEFSGPCKPFLKTSLLEDLDISKFPNVEKVYSKFIKEVDRLECDSHKLTYLFFKKPKIYDYLMKHPDLLKNCRNTVYEVPSVEILEEINKHHFNGGMAFERYVFNNSYISEQEAQYLNSILEKCKLSNEWITSKRKIANRIKKLY